MPALRPVVGHTVEEARAKSINFRSCSTRWWSQHASTGEFGDLSRYPLDGPVPLDTLGPNELRSISERLLARVRREKPTIRQLYQQVAGMGGFCLIGTAEQIADVMQEWLENEACDGFNITPTHLPSGCEDFVDLVIPELQRRGLFRTEYEGETLRENLGLKPHINRYVRTRATLAAH